MVQAAMQPGYDRGFAEKGTGSHRRRCALIEGHVAKSAPSMFKGAIKPVVDGLAKLRADVKTLLRTTCSKKLLDDLRLNYSVLWEPVSADMLRVRATMAHPLNVATLEVRSALRRLLDSQGAKPDDAKPANDDDDDDDIVDITAKVAAEKRVEVIDVDDLDVSDAPPAPPPANSAATKGGVKAERA